MKKVKRKDLDSISEREISFPMPRADEVLTDELINRAKTLFSAGLHESTVAGLLGLHPETFKEYLVKGSAYAKGREAKLFQECIKSLNGSELELVHSLREAALGSPAVYKLDKSGNVQLDGEGKPIVLKSEVKPNPIYACWLLERRHKSKYGRELQIKASPLENPHMFVEAVQHEEDVSDEQAANAVDEMNHILTQLKKTGVI